MKTNSYHKNTSQSQQQVQSLSQDLIYASKLNFSTVILLCKRVLAINKIRKYRDEELIGQNIDYLPRSKYQEEISLVDACSSFQNLTGQSLDGTQLKGFFEKLVLDYGNTEYRFVDNCLNLIKMALNDEPLEKQKQAYQNLYDLTESAFRPSANYTPSQNLPQDVVQNIANQKVLTSMLFNNKDSDISKEFTKEFDRHSQVMEEEFPKEIITKYISVYNYQKDGKQNFNFFIKAKSSSVDIVNYLNKSKIDTTYFAQSIHNWVKNQSKENLSFMYSNCQISLQYDD